MPVTWTGSPRTVQAIRDLLIVHASPGVLRLVLQQLTLREDGRAVGRHEIIDAVSDVGGNLVSIPIVAAVRADPTASSQLDAALAALRADIAAQIGSEVDSLEVITTADGRREARFTACVEVSPEDLERRPAHPALHGGPHQITHQAPELDALRDLLAEPEHGRLRRTWDGTCERVRRLLFPGD